MTKALVLSAGYGTRLHPFTTQTPKPLLKIAGKPILGYIFENLARAGISEVAVNLHYQADQIRDYCGDGSKWGVSIHYSEEAQLLGTAGTVLSLKNWFTKDSSSADFLVLYGDVITNQNIKTLLEFHQTHQAWATLLVHADVDNSIVVMDEKGEVECFAERPTSEERSNLHQKYSKPFWVNSGVQVLSSKIFDLIPARIPADLPRDVYVPLAVSRHLYAMPLKGYRRNIDSTQALQEAEQEIQKGLFL